MPVGDNGWAGSAAAWVEFIDETDPNRAYVLDPVMNSKTAEVKGLRVLDVGCGEGRFCRALSERGAATVGIDPTPALLEVARARHPEGEYVECGAEAMPFKDREFDVVVSYVSLCDIPDYRAAIKEKARVLKPAGRMVVALHNAFVTTSPTGWLKDESGRKIVFPVDHYTFESASKVAWCGIEVVNYHRPMSAYMSAFLDEGLHLVSYEEPLPSPQDVTDHPDLADYLRVSVFTVMEWAKP